MRIEKIGDGFEKDPPSVVQATFGPALNDRINKVTDSALRAELSALIVAVEEKARRLTAGRNKKEFEDYKDSVKKFMNRVVSGAFKLEEKQSRKKDGKFVVLLTMQKVDDALDKLGQLLLAGQQDSMHLVASLDEIRGMLLDLYL